MKFDTPVTPMSKPARRLKPCFHGKNRVPTVRLLGITVSVARQPSELGLIAGHA
jgi:hypothetical protein